MLSIFALGVIIYSPINQKRLAHILMHYHPISTLGLYYIYPSS